LPGSRGFGAEAGCGAACAATCAAGRAVAAGRAAAAASVGGADAGLAGAGLAEMDAVEVDPEAAVAAGRAVVEVGAAAVAAGRAVEAGVPVAGAADALVGRGGGGLRRSPTVDGRDVVLAVALLAAFGAGRGVAGAACGVKRSPMVGIAARGDAGRDGVPVVDVAAGAGAAGDETAGLSAARAGAGLGGAGRSLPSGGGLDPVTTGCPLLQAASSTLEKKPAQRKAMFADSARSAQCWDGGKSTQ